MGASTNPKIGVRKAAAPRRYVPSQLSPIAEAFGYEGGWSVERRAGRDWWRDLPPWPCARPGCGQVIRWRPGKKGPRMFRKYCSAPCRATAGYRATRAALASRPEDLARARRQHAEASRRRYHERVRDPEWRARERARRQGESYRAWVRQYQREYKRAYRRRKRQEERTPEQIQRERERWRQQYVRARARLAARPRTAEQVQRDRERWKQRARKQRAKWTPEQSARHRASCRAWRRARAEGEVAR